MSEVPLPKDHEGREIPLGTKVLYDEEGNELCVKVVECGGCSPRTGACARASRRDAPAGAGGR